MLQASKAIPLLVSAMLVLALAGASAADATATYSIVYYGPDGAPGVTVPASGGTFNLGVYEAHTITVSATFQINNTSATQSLKVSAASCPGGDFTVRGGGGLTLLPGAGTGVSLVVPSTYNGPAKLACTLSFTVGGAPFVAQVSTAILPSTLGAWWDASGTPETECNDNYLFPTTAVGTPESEVFDVGNASATPLTVSSTTVVSNEDCFFLLSTPVSPIPAHSFGQARLRLYSATTAVSCVALVTIVSSDPSSPTFSFFVNGFVGSAPYTYTPLTAPCPAS